MPWDRSPDNHLTSAQRRDYLMGCLGWNRDLLMFAFALLLLAVTGLKLAGSHFAVMPLAGDSSLLPVSLILIATVCMTWTLRHWTTMSHRRTLLGLVISLSASWITALACIEGMARRDGVFLRTSKAAGTRQRLRTAFRLSRFESLLTIALYVSAGLLAASAHPPLLLVAIIALQGTVYLCSPIASFWNLHTQRVPAPTYRQRFEQRRLREASSRRHRRARPRTGRRDGAGLGCRRGLRIFGGTNPVAPGERRRRQRSRSAGKPAPFPGRHRRLPQARPSLIKSGPVLPCVLGEARAAALLISRNQCCSVQPELRHRLDCPAKGACTRRQHGTTNSGRNSGDHQTRCERSAGDNRVGRHVSDAAVTSFGDNLSQPGGNVTLELFASSRTLTLREAVGGTFRQVPVPSLSTTPEVSIKLGSASSEQDRYYSVSSVLFFMLPHSSDGGRVRFTFSFETSSLGLLNSLVGNAGSKKPFAGLTFALQQSGAASGLTPTEWTGTFSTANVTSFNESLSGSPTGTVTLSLQ